MILPSGSGRLIRREFGCHEPPSPVRVQSGIGPRLKLQPVPHELLRGLIISKEAFWIGTTSGQAGALMQPRMRMERNRKRDVNFKGTSQAFS
jgi:hypothetical protein